MAPEENLQTMQITIRMLSGRTFTLDVGATDTVNEVKAKISENEGIPISQQQLVLGDMQLVDDDMMIWNYGIEDKCTLSLVLSEYFKIEIKHEKETIMMMDVKESDSIDNIRAKIHDHVEDSDLKIMRLFKATVVHDEDEDWDDYEEPVVFLEDGKTLADYGITDYNIENANKHIYIDVDWEGSGDEDDSD